MAFTPSCYDMSSSEILSPLGLFSSSLIRLTSIYLDLKKNNTCKLHLNLTVHFLSLHIPFIRRSTPNF